MSCCKAACLRSRFLAMSRSSPSSSASASLNAAAMARCSAKIGAWKLRSFRNLKCRL